MKVRLIEERLGYSGFFRLHRLTVEHELYDGNMSEPRAHEVLERSDVAAAVLLDPVSDRIVMVEQFRPGAYAAGLHPWQLDIVAGRIEPGQSPRETIIREIAEESGLMPHAAALGLLQSGTLPLWAGLALAWISGRCRE